MQAQFTSRHAVTACLVRLLRRRRGSDRAGKATEEMGAPVEARPDRAVQSELGAPLRNTERLTPSATARGDDLDARGSHGHDNDRSAWELPHRLRCALHQRPHRPGPEDDEAQNENLRFVPDPRGRSNLRNPQIHRFNREKARLQYPPNSRRTPRESGHARLRPPSRRLRSTSQNQNPPSRSPIRPRLSVRPGAKGWSLYDGMDRVFARPSHGDQWAASL